MGIVLVSTANRSESDTDEVPLTEALRARGLAVRWVNWDSPEGDALASADARSLVILRSPWNYHRDLPRFLGWLSRVNARHALDNPYDVVCWNSHKGYLRDVDSWNVPTVPFSLVRVGDGRALAEHLAAWDDVDDFVVKPAVSAGSFETKKIRRAVKDDELRWFQRMLRERDMLVQPYMRGVDARGERSLVFLDGMFSHAIRKSPRFSGMSEAVSEHAVDVTDNELSLAQRALALASKTTLLYARVDVVEDDDGAPVVMELELIEPSLFLSVLPHATARFVDAIGRRAQAIAL